MTDLCSCGHEESDGRGDVLACPVHGIGPEAMAASRETAVECPACGAPVGMPCNAPAEGVAAIEVCADRADAVGTLGNREEPEASHESENAPREGECCPNCAGEGYVDGEHGNEDCPMCDGSGCVPADFDPIARGWRRPIA